ncbi:Flagellar brake protein YcgR [Sporomusa aerivorans]
MTIAMPMSKGYPVLLPRGEVFFGRTVINMMAYEFTTKLLAKQVNPLPIWVIAAPYNIKKIQQRSFVRIDLALPVQIRETADDQTGDQAVIDAVTKDISGGGVQIVTTRQWEIGDKLLVTVNYPEIGVLTLNSEVVRVQQPQPDRVLFWVGVKFLDINEKDRGNIIKLIFKKQLELRRKGLD